jgi:subtilisin family serine protease
MGKSLSSYFRSIGFAVVAFALFAASADAQVSRTPHVDPALRALLRPDMQATLDKYAAAHGRSAQRQPLEGAVVLDRGGVSGALRVGILIEARSDLAPRMLRNAGAEIGTVIPLGDDHMIITARVPVAMLEMLTTASELTRLEADRVMHVVNDSAMRSIGADQVRSRTAAGWGGTAGEDVIVGVYDTGIDFRHDDFRDETGRTRLVGLWDQTVTGTPPASFAYGHYCSAADIQRTIDDSIAACTERDSNGHGSHVAGTAAGDGSAGNTPFRYAGVAPRASLLVVKGGDGSFFTANILDGLKFMSETARALRKPAVVNLSLGDQSGPHDGSTTFEAGIDALARDSFVIVTTAGNEGSNGNTGDPTPLHLIHASGQVVTGDSVEFSFEVPTFTANSGPCNDRTVIEFWGGSSGLLGADQHDIRLIRPDGTSVVAAPNALDQNDSPNGALSVDQLSVNPVTGDRRAELVVSDCGPSQAVPAPGVYRIRVKGRSVTSGKPFHMWITRSQLGTSTSRGLTGFDNRFLIGTPGTAHNVITVAAYTTRVSWPNSTTAGQAGYTFRETVGDLARFSSGGPTRDGRQRPDIAAPGIGIMSTLSRDASSLANRIAPDGVHYINQGTSMAAPMVAGTVALMLQLNPGMDVEDVRALLAQGAVQDAFTSRTYSGGGGAARDWWGAGKLNARNSVGLIAGANNPNAVASVLVTPRADTLVVNASVQMLVTATDVAGARVLRPITYSSSDPAVATVDANGLITARRIGSAFIIAQVESARDSTAVQVVGPAALVLSGSAIAPASVSSVKGARVPVLRLQLGTRGYEAIDVEALVFSVTGDDPGARLVVVRDDDGNGSINGPEPVVGSVPLTLVGGVQTSVTVPLTNVRIPRSDSLRFVVAIDMSGSAPNASVFQVSLAPRETQTRGSLSRAEDRIETLLVAIGPAPFSTSLLRADEIFALSENPVRGTRVIFNFSVRPTVAGIYTLNGRRVVDLLPDLSTDGRVEWNLMNEQGTRVAPGVYLVVFSVSGRLVREKLIITRPAGVPFQNSGF